jgi:predicted transcriptional regulator
MLLGIMPIQNAPKTRPTTVRLDAALFDKLKILADKGRWDVVELIRFAVEKIVDLTPEEVAKMMQQGGKSPRR